MFVLKEIEKVCKAFLWFGDYSSSKPGNIAWAKVCTLKQAWGLGVRQVMAWNKVVLAKYFWTITTKQDNLWVKWVHKVYI